MLGRDCKIPRTYKKVTGIFKLFLTLSLTISLTGNSTFRRTCVLRMNSLVKMLKNEGDKIDLLLWLNLA